MSATLRKVIIVFTASTRHFSKNLVPAIVFSYSNGDSPQHHLAIVPSNRFHRLTSVRSFEAVYQLLCTLSCHS